MEKITIKNNLKRETSFGNHILGDVTLLKNITNTVKNVVVEANIKNIKIKEYDGYAIVSLMLKDNTGKISAKIIKKGNKSEIADFVSKIDLKKRYRISGIITFDDVFENKLAMIVQNVEQI